VNSSASIDSILCLVPFILALLWASVYCTVRITLRRPLGNLYHLESLEHQLQSFKQKVYRNLYILAYWSTTLCFECFIAAQLQGMYSLTRLQYSSLGCV
jgi:hypothetical protein